jgi:hypothetical protein
MIMYYTRLLSTKYEVFDKRRLTERKYILHSDEYAKIEEYFRKLYKI